MRFGGAFSTVCFFFAGTAQVFAESIPPAVLTQIHADLLSQLSTITTQPSVATLISEVVANIPSTLLTQIHQVTVDLAELATNPDVYLTARPTFWESVLPSSLRSAYDAYETSLVGAQAGLIRSDLEEASVLLAGTVTVTVTSGTMRTSGTTSSLMETIASSTSLSSSSVAVAATITSLASTSALISEAASSTTVSVASVTTGAAFGGNGPKVWGIAAGVVGAAGFVAGVL